MKNNLLQHFLDRGIISIDDIMSSNKEDIMETILSRVHKSKITKTKDGRFTTRVPDDTKPNGTRMVRRNSNTDLFEYLISFYGVASNSSLSVKDLFFEWLNYKKIFVGAKNKGISDSTITRYYNDFMRLIAPSDLADFFIINIDSVKLETALIEIINSDKDISINRDSMYVSTFKNVFGYLKGMFEYAVRKDYISSSPLLKIDKNILLTFCTPNKVQLDEERVLSVDELDKLLIAIKDHELAHPYYMPDYAIELASLTGTRVGELAALKWDCIDNEYIHIDFSEHRIDYIDKPSELIIAEPKNRKHRKIPMTPEIADLFNRIKDLNIHSEFVFSRKSGNRYTGHDIGCAVDRRANEACISKTSIHGIRRTVSSMLNTILPRQAVANLLGHLETTNERFYDYDVTDFDIKRKALITMSHKVTDFNSYLCNKKRTRTV